jgi:hemerythrin
MGADAVLAEIEREHEELTRLVESLDLLLPGKGSEAGDSIDPGCANAITDFCEHLLEFMLQHFQREELAMQALQATNPRLKSDFDAHREHHADLSHWLSDAIGRAAHPSVAYRDLRRVLDEWLEVHLAQHDAILGQALRLKAG